MDEVILKETCPMENGVRIVMTLNMTTSISYVQFINREPSRLFVDPINAILF